jgi:hypothetical protein
MMKKQVQFMLLLLCISLLITGCNKHDIPVKTDTTFTLSITDNPEGLIFTGYFTSSGDPTTAGTFTMNVELVGKDSLHCSQTLVVPTEGSITIISDCSTTTNTGVWYIIAGTGTYANLKGDGDLLMSPPTENTPDLEAMYGQTWRQ